MNCVLLDCCHFFADYMKDLPKSAAYIRENLCFKNYETCNRYRIYMEYGEDNVPYDLDPIDTLQVEKIRACLNKKLASAGE